ncbi:MAG: sigma factor [Myxococcota bacterium]
MQSNDAKVDWVASELRKHAARLRRFVSARVPATDVEDVLQAAALRAVERSASLEDPQRVVPWLYRLHRNVVVDALRKRQSNERLVAPGAPLPEIPTSESDRMCGCSLTQARRIKPAYAAMLALVDEGDATLAEAADTLGISTTNAAVRLHRARKALRRAMLEHCGVQTLRDCIECRCVTDGCCAA